MPWYSVYEVETGRLISIASELGDPLPEGLAYVETEEEPKGTWDAASQQWLET